MNSQEDSPFQSIESAHGFVTLLAGTVSEAKVELEADIAREAERPSRRLDALRLALYKVQKLEQCMNRTGRILNDLRTCRRLLCGERNFALSSTGPLETGRPVAA